MNGMTNAPRKTDAYVTKDASLVRELMHPSFVPGLGMSLAEAVVEPGASTDPHYHRDFDEIYYCLEGEGALFINGAAHAFGPGACYLLGRGDTHHLAAVTRLRLLCVCCPAYTHEKTVLADGRE